MSPCLVRQWSPTLQLIDMKILYHHRTLGDGAEGIHVREMINAFRSLGHEVRVVGPVGEEENGDTVRVSLFSKIRLLTPKILYEIFEILYNGYGYYLLQKATKAFEPDFLYDRYITFNASSVLFAKSHRIPVVVEVNAPLALERTQQQDEKLFFRKTADRFEKWICSKADQTLVVSSPLKDYLVSVGVPAEKVTVLPNGVNQKRFSASTNTDVTLRLKLAIPDDAVVLGFVGIFRPWHGLDLLLQGFRYLQKKHKKVHLLLVGDGPILPELELAAKEAGLKNNITFTGRVAHEEIPRYISLFDIAVSPKATFYASPMKILEYMAMGKVVVAPDTQNIRDLLIDGKSGLLFAAEDVADLVGKLELLVGDESLRNRVGLNARMNVLRHRQWTNNASRVLDLIHKKRLQQPSPALVAKAAQTIRSDHER